jgi:hypothetical protein
MLFSKTLLDQAADASIRVEEHRHTPGFIQVDFRPLGGHVQASMYRESSNIWSGQLWGGETEVGKKTGPKDDVYLWCLNFAVNGF